MAHQVMQEALAELDAHLRTTSDLVQPLQRPQSPRRFPGPSQGRDVAVLSQYDGEQQSSQRQSAEQEETAAEATARMSASCDHAIAQMRSVHGDGDPDVVSGGWDGPRGGFDDDLGPGHHPEEPAPGVPVGPVGPTFGGVGPQVGVPQGPGAAVGGGGPFGLGGLGGLGGLPGSGAPGWPWPAPSFGAAGAGRPPSVVATGGGVGGATSSAGGRGPGARGPGARGARGGAAVRTPPGRTPSPGRAGTVAGSRAGTRPTGSTTTGSAPASCVELGLVSDPRRLDPSPPGRRAPAGVG